MIATPIGLHKSKSAVARSIRPFAAAFLQMDADQRRQAPIELPGVDDAHKYQYAFKRLPPWEIVHLPHRRVFYGPLRWTGRIIDRDGVFRIELYAGR